MKKKNKKDFLIQIPEDNDLVIFDSSAKTYDIINKYNRILCSISGGSDSDVLLDLCYRLDVDNKITYVFFDTGIEYEATKTHISNLERKYGIRINRIMAKKPVPLCCKEYGQPFISKSISEWMERLQKHNFQWEDEPFEDLIKKYPTCRAALRWWCNDFGKDSRFNIDSKKFLKQFIMYNPPEFRISNKCCKYAKKDTLNRYIKENEVQLNIYGVRKSEGGARGTAYKTCFSVKKNVTEFRPLLWYKKETKDIYNTYFKIKNSECYKKYGLKRTGCAGCPFSANFEEELNILSEFEPKLHRAANVIFGDSYEYTRSYNKFIKEFEE